MAKIYRKILVQLLLIRFNELFGHYINWWSVVDNKSAPILKMVKGN